MSPLPVNDWQTPGCGLWLAGAPGANGDVAGHAGGGGELGDSDGLADLGLDVQDLLAGLT
jgi:hypothetical protein